MASIHDINSYLKAMLDPKDISDIALNGIQVENDGEISKIAFAVDASLATIKKALDEKCNLLIVHHGLFWSKVLPVTGSHKARIKEFLNHNLGLIAYHLPLDIHPEYGNNSRILLKLGITEIKPFGFYKGLATGFTGESMVKMKIEEVYAKLKILPDINDYLPFGKQDISKIAVVSGGGGHYFNEAVENGVDLFITGDAEHVLYHQALENKVNVLFAGHYFTEVFGVSALREVIENRFNLPTVFCDYPTGL